MVFHSLHLFGSLARPVSSAELTVLLRNIPSTYTRSLLLDQINSFRGACDFFSLPFNFESVRNMGYVFIDFMDVDDCQRDGVKCRVCLLRFSSAKVCQVSQAASRDWKDTFATCAFLDHATQCPVSWFVAARMEWMSSAIDGAGAVDQIKMRACSRVNPRTCSISHETFKVRAMYALIRTVVDPELSPDGPFAIAVDEDMSEVVTKKLRSMASGRRSWSQNRHGNSPFERPHCSGVLTGQPQNW